MKTLQDLKQMLTEHNGKLKIGDLEIEYPEGKDIDIRLEGQIAMWIPKEKDNASLLEDKITSIMADIQDGRDALKREREGLAEVDKIKDMFALAEKKLAEAQNAIGKVEAYEKLLLGRDITISK